MLIKLIFVMTFTIEDLLVYSYIENKRIFHFDNEFAYLHVQCSENIF